jgi:hypothetical protein
MGGVYQRFVEETNELAQQASDAIAAAARPAPVPYYPWKDADEVLRTWRKLEQQDRRRTIRQLLTSAVVHPVGSPERITIDWRTDVSHQPAGA